MMLRILLQEKVKKNLQCQERKYSSAVGVRVSRAQSRLALSQTPAIEKAPAMQGPDGFFESSPEHEMSLVRLLCIRWQVRLRLIHNEHL